MPRSTRLRRPGLAVALLAVISMTAAGCGPAGSGDPGRAVGDAATTSTTTAPVVVEDGDLRVAVVADSEVPPEVADRIDAAPGIALVTRALHDGFTMAQLDPHADDALDLAPDVFVYSGSTNDLADGPAAVLAGLDERLRRYVGVTCTVMAVPVFRYEPGTPEEVEARTEGTRILERAAADTGARIASYLDVSIALAAEGKDFFAEGELGALHPGPAAYPGIAEAIVEQIEGCRTSS